jgi:hypothetical protein
MAERTSTCNPHIERETLHVYFCLLQALSFVSGRGYLSQHLPQRWIGRTTAEDQALLRWPPRSPDLTPCDFFFFLWGNVKDSAFLPPLPLDLPEQRRCIITAITAIDRDMRHRVSMGFTDTKSTMRQANAICRSHVTILYAIQVYRFYEMCQ